MFAGLSLHFWESDPSTQFVSWVPPGAVVCIDRDKYIPCFAFGGVSSVEDKFESLRKSSCEDPESVMTNNTVFHEQLFP